MKFIDTLRLACRNIYHNKAHFTLAVISITMLSVLVMTIANFCWFYGKNADANVLKSINADGAYMSAAVPVNSNAFLNQSDIYDFAALANSLDINDRYRVNTDINGGDFYINDEYIGIKPYIGRLNAAGVEIINGALWTQADEGKNHIWLSEEKSSILGIGVGGAVAVKIGKNGEIRDFTVKGIVGGGDSYIDARYFNMTGISVYQTNSDFKNIGEIKALRAEIHDFGKTRPSLSINGNMMESLSDEIGVFIYGTCAALIAISLGVCLACVLNTLKIGIENNNAALGLMKALGAKNKNLKTYVLIQIGILIIIGTLAAAIISCVLGYFAVGSPVGIIMNMIFTETADISAFGGFWYVLPLLNFALLGGVVMISAAPMLKRYAAVDAIKIINEGNTL